MRVDGGVGRLADVDRWIARVRVFAVVFAVVEVGLFTESHPEGYEPWAWVLTGAFAVGAVALLVASRQAQPAPLLPAAALAFDTGVICAYGLLYSFEYGSPTRWALIFAVVEGALRYGRAGGVLVPVALLPYLALVEWWRADRFGPPPFHIDRVSFPFGIFLITGLICGWLVSRLAREAGFAEGRAAEAERLRDELGRRVDLLEAANRCARALGSSLRHDEAFDAFVEEVRGAIRFDRLSVVRYEEGATQVVATAGLGSDRWPPGASIDTIGGIVQHLLGGRVDVRQDLSRDTRPEEVPLVELGLRSRVVAPLMTGGRVIGFFTLARSERNAFSPEEVEFATLLGRLVGTAVQNIRAYEAERTTVEELRRLSALRADFVSLVSHELRSPMAAVIGSARTLQQRWRELGGEQREAFLAVIGDETSRLSRLIEDVLHTSRIEAGTFTYRFADVDLARLVRDAVSTAELAQDEVRLSVDVPSGLPAVRGDAERLRQLLDNLVSNAVKFSGAGQEVRVTASSVDGHVALTVRDEGPGIALEQHGLIFEKFGRAAAGSAKPGTGLGLFIARSIAEAHGGTLEVQSAPGHGATFTLTLPV